MKISTVLFDWDGCLAQTLGEWLKVYRQVLTDYDLEKTDKEIVDTLFGTGFQGPEAFGIKDPAVFYEKVDSLIAQRLQNVPLYPGATTALTVLKEHDIKLAVVTSSDRNLFEPAIKLHHLENIFDVTITFDDVTHTKPHPEPLFKAMEMLRSIKEEAIIIGDSPHDIEAGQAAGIKTALFYPEENKLFYSAETIQKQQPDLLVHSFDQFINRIL